MLIPVSTTFRVCDIWRGYWSQRLLWDVGGNLAFTTATVEQHRNVHNILSDFVDEIDLYSKAGLLVQFLLAWKSSASSLPQRMVEVAEAMAETGFWGQEDVALMRAWVTDLDTVGYQFPPIAPQDQLQLQPESSGEHVVTKKSHSYPSSWRRYAEVTLVVMFNKGYPELVSVATTLHKMYMPVFGKVIFTGQPVPLDLPSDVVWVPCEDTNGGELMHKCLAHVMEDYPMVQANSAGGYLMIGDDTVLDLCALQKLNSSNIWLPDARNLLASVDIHTARDWHWERPINGGKAIRLELHDAMISLSGRARVAARQQGLYKGNLTEKTAFYGSLFTDFVYIPQRVVLQYVYLAYHFSEHPVHHETAFANIVRLLTDDVESLEEVPTLRPVGHLLYAGISVENDPSAVMLPGGKLMNGSVFLHPVKLSSSQIHNHFVQWWLQATCSL